MRNGTPRALLLDYGSVISLQAQFFDLRDVQGNVAAIAARLKLGFS
jgi:hypothetical protein